jgi:uncharacterized protein YcfL
MKFSKIFLLPMVAVVLAGCTSYQVGSTLPEDVQGISLCVINKSEQPQIEVEVMKALRAEIQQDGRLSIRSEAEADVALTVTLNNYKLNALAYDTRLGSFAREYRTVINASSVLTRSKTGEVIAENPTLLGEAEFAYDADLTTAKRLTLPDAAADLARKVVSRVTTAW